MGERQPSRLLLCHKRKLPPGSSPGATAKIKILFLFITMVVKLPVKQLYPGSSPGGGAISGEGVSVCVLSGAL